MLVFLCVCSTVLILSHIDLNCRFITFDTRLNTLAVSTKTKRSNLKLFILLFIYLLIFDYYFIIFMSYEFWKDRLDIRRIIQQSVIFVNMFHYIIASIILSVKYILCYFAYISIASCYPHESIAIWLVLIRLTLCPDIHPNPGPAHSNNFAGGFLSFCKWNYYKRITQNTTMI